LTLNRMASSIRWIRFLAYTEVSCTLYPIDSCTLNRTKNIYSMQNISSCKKLPSCCFEKTSYTPPHISSVTERWQTRWSPLRFLYHRELSDSCNDLIFWFSFFSTKTQPPQASKLMEWVTFPIPSVMASTDPK